MPRSSKEHANLPDLLAEISASYCLQPPQPGEITVAMLVAEQPKLSADRALKLMKRAVRDGLLAEAVYRLENGRRVLAWARKVKKG